MAPTVRIGLLRTLSNDWLCSDCAQAAQQRVAVVRWHVRGSVSLGRRHERRRELGSALRISVAMGAQQLVRCALVWLICAFSGRWEHVTGEVVHMEQRGDGGGYHTAESWQRAQKLIHKHAHTFVPSIDENKDGKMSLPEVYQHLAIVMRRQHQGLDGALRSEFGEVDADGSNGVSLEEYQKYEVFEATENTEFGWKVTTDVHQRNIDKYAQAMFALLDLNDDGQLNADEFEVSDVEDEA